MAQYELPLFFLWVRTNMCYIAVAVFIVQQETKESVSEVLQLLKTWNEGWSPGHFMVDFSMAEINAVESVFTGQRELVCFPVVYRNLPEADIFYWGDTRDIVISHIWVKVTSTSSIFWNRLQSCPLWFPPGEGMGRVDKKCWSWGAETGRGSSLPEKSRCCWHSPDVRAGTQGTSGQRGMDQESPLPEMVSDNMAAWTEGKNTNKVNRKANHMRTHAKVENMNLWMTYHCTVPLYLFSNVREGETEHILTEMGHSFPWGVTAAQHYNQQRGWAAERDVQVQASGEVQDPHHEWNDDIHRWWFYPAVAKEVCLHTLYY